MSSYYCQMMKKIEDKQIYFDTVNKMLLSYEADAVEILTNKLHEHNISTEFEKIKIDTGKSFEKHEHNIDPCDNQNDISDDSKNSIAKKIYKKLILKIHPDKSKISEDFITVKRAYDTGDINTLIKYCLKYEIEISETSNEITLYLERQYYNIKKQIATLKSTVAYKIFVEDNVDAVVKIFITHEKLRIENEKRRKEYDEYEKMIQTRQNYTLSNV